MSMEGGVEDKGMKWRIRSMEGGVEDKEVEGEGLRWRIKVTHLT